MLKNYVFDKEKLMIFKNNLTSILADEKIKVDVSLTEGIISNGVLHQSCQSGQSEVTITFLVSIKNENIKWEKHVILTNSDTLEQIYDNAKSVKNEYLIAITQYL